ncbi:GDSL esterase/lipase EXL3 [Rhynchospora pubera]|uniref:GDSL esterase/lipase EXL3 n=1 Tax=Rhynchospora pubera TaxID=906938 RepID=A0AAV8E073_9POAL|nr:GDSL esterase/lipase EXL3 [Rhynchospora pubera]
MVTGAPLHAASLVCVKDLIQAYLGTDLKSDDLLTGVSFGSGGTGYDPLTPVLVSVLSMSKQLDLFVEYKERLKEIAGPDTAASIVVESLYLVCAGSNDILNNYYLGLIRRLQYDISSYADFLIQQISDFVHRLYQHGARKIAIVGLPPLGCLPLQRALFGGPKRDCEASRNRAALLFNSMLEKYIFRLQAELKCQTIGYVDIYDILLDIITSPQNFGFEEATKGCCGTGHFEVSFLCNSITASTCVDDTKFVFWDSVHPTQQAYKIIVDYVFPRYIQILL